MSERSSIEWTDASWTPLRARVRDDAPEIARAKGYTSLVQIAEQMRGHIGPHCERVSSGCDHCYSETNNHRCLPGNGTGLPFDRRSRDLVETFLDERILLQPLRWRKPRRIFVCSQTDLFGEWVSDSDIDQMFAIMALCPQHTFQVLTKRPERMREHLSSDDACDRIEAFMWELIEQHIDPCERRSDDLRATAQDLFDGPLPNVWLGVSCEDEPTAQLRIRDLLATPAAFRFVSLEPLLGSIDVRPWLACEGHLARTFGNVFLDWVITGGESGPHARPEHPQWFRDIRDSCVAAGVPFFHKQNGKLGAGRLLDGRTWDQMPEGGQ